MSEMCGTRLAEKYRTQKIISLLRTIAQRSRAISSQLGHNVDILKKILLNSAVSAPLVKWQYLPHMSPEYGELRLTNG